MKRIKTIIVTLGLGFAINSLAQNNTVRYFGQSETSYQPSQPYGMNEEAGKYADVGDAKIWYEIYGKGNPVVVLHGGLVGSPAEMGEFIDNLVKNHFQAIVISTRGHAKSYIGKAKATYQQKAKDLKKVLENANIKQKVSLLGFSDGGYTALHFAQQYPEQTKQVVAIGAGEWAKGYIQGSRKADMKFADIVQFDPQYWQQQAFIRPEPNKTEEWFEQANSTYNETIVSKEIFSNIQAPTLLVVGEKDKNATLDSVLNAYKMLPKGSLSVIPNANHPVFIENFSAVWNAVQPFLAQQK
ncbi:TPA: alpha/beta hydrolase [Mannheimia haemolytica]|nr:alpha/beta hydrolase [Mannheimia haemolytica]